jgi:hypothetical protein
MRIKIIDQTGKLSDKERAAILAKAEEVMPKGKLDVWVHGVSFYPNRDASKMKHASIGPANRTTGYDEQTDTTTVRNFFVDKNGDELFECIPD